MKLVSRKISFVRSKHRRESSDWFHCRMSQVRNKQVLVFQGEVLKDLGPSHFLERVIIEKESHDGNSKFTSPREKGDIAMSVDYSFFISNECGDGAAFKRTSSRRALYINK